MTRHDGGTTPESTKDDSSRLCRPVTEPGGENEKPENFLEEPREVIRRRRTDRRSHASQKVIGPAANESANAGPVKQIMVMSAESTPHTHPTGKRRTAGRLFVFPGYTERDPVSIPGVSPISPRGKAVSVSDRTHAMSHETHHSSACEIVHAFEVGQININFCTLKNKNKSQLTVKFSSTTLIEYRQFHAAGSNRPLLNCRSAA